MKKNVCFSKKILILNFQASEFRVVQNAFKALEFADLAIESIWKLVAVILHLGNIDFDATEDNGEQIASISRYRVYHIEMDETKWL